MVGYCSQADRVVAVSEAVSGYLRHKLSLAPRKVRVVTNGVEDGRTPTSEEVAAARRELGATSNQTLIFAMACRLHDANKRVSDGLSAFARLDHPDAAFAVIGDGRDRTALEAHAAKLGITSRTRFLGYRRDVRQLLHGADVFVLASESESFGQVIVEAMLAGLPVISTPVGGPSEIVVPHVTGLFVPVGSPESIATAMQLLAASPETRVVMGRAGRERARRHFTAERYVSDVARVYDELLAPTRRLERSGRTSALAS